jgi:hypothetical protein
MLDFVNNDSLPTVCMEVDKIVGHRRSTGSGTLSQMDRLQQTTMEPLTQFKQDDFVTCAIYARENGLWIRMVGRLSRKWLKDQDTLPDD